MENLKNEIQHLVDSTRYLIDRTPKDKNAQKFDRKIRIEPRILAEDFDDSQYHFEMTLNVKIDDPNNNIVSYGNTKNYVIVDTRTRRYYSNLFM